MSTSSDFNLSEKEFESIRTKADMLIAEVALGKSVEQIIFEHAKGDSQDITEEECKKISETLVQNSAMFCEKLETTDSNTDTVKDTIIELIKDMPAKNAMEFLKLLAYVKELSSSSAIQQVLAGQNDIELSDIESSIKERLETKSNLSEAEQIDILIDKISSDEMDIFAMIGGNTHLLDVLKAGIDSTETSQLISDYTKNKISKIFHSYYKIYV